MVFKKLTEEGRPFIDTVSFSQRELARLVGQKSFGGYQSQKVYKAISQLRHTDIHAFMYDKVTQEYTQLEFYLFPSVLFSGRKQQIHTCSIRVDQSVVTSLNNRHWACFNWEHLRELEPIGMAIYKRLFRHFSNLYGHELKRLGKASLHTEEGIRSARKNVLFEKSYEDICTEWLGGLNPYRYKSEIKRRIGLHIDVVKQTGLLRSWSIEPMARDRGWKLVFRPGISFFRNYDRFYMTDWQPQLRFKQSSDQHNIQYPLDALSYFYKKLSGGKEIDKTVFPKTQQELALKLIDRYGYDELIELIDFTFNEARKTNFDIKTFGAVRNYIAHWEGLKKSHETKKAMRAKEEEENQATRLKDAYNQFLEDLRDKSRASLTSEELDELEQKAAQIHQEDHPDVPKFMVDMGVQITLHRLLLEMQNPPSFEEWIASERKKLSSS